MKLKSKNILTIISAFSLIISASSILQINANNLTTSKVGKSNSIENEIQSDKNTNDFSKIAPLDTYGETPILSQKMGPIVSYGSQINALNWFGQVVWSFDLSKEKEYMPGHNVSNKSNKLVRFVNRAFVNWSLDTERNVLWLLTNAYYVNENSGDNGQLVGPQKVIGLNSITGEVLYNYDIEESATTGFDIFYQVQVLKNGNVLVYSNGHARNWWQNIIIDYKTGERTSIVNQTQAQENLYQNVKDSLEEFKKQNNHQDFVQQETKMLYSISVTNNVNIAIFCDFSPDILSDGYKNVGSGDLLLKLVDDKFEPINITDKKSPWYKGIYVKNLMSRDEAIKVQDQNKGSNAFNKSFYKTIDGKLYYAAWESFFAFSTDFIPGYGIKVYQQKFDNKNIQSYTMDVNGNVFLKFKKDTNIIRLNISGDDVDKLSVTESTYYNLSDSSDEQVIKNANSYVIFNVWGETGSLMMINAKDIIGGTNITEFDEAKDKEHGYGLAVGIIPNSQNPSTGDTKGVLNGDNTIQTTADFEIKPDSKSSKLPSEITKNDILITNDGFFTKNSEKNEDGSLKYPAFNLTNVDDEKGTFTVEVHVDKIPWFSYRLPSDSIPTKIVKEFGENNKAEIITNKTSWKSQDLLSYDFKNSTPSEITIDDIKEFDPFQVSFSSKVVLDSSGNQKYPKKTYSIQNIDNSNGTINIGVNYEYYALSEDVNILKSYSTYNTYNVFKSSETKEFYFAGASNSGTNNTKIDINNVPQLKKLATSNVLPSSFINNKLTKNDYLPFIDTNRSKGYPISKLDISFQANDSAGELTINVRSKNDGNSFSQTYYGLNKNIDYLFEFNEILSIDKSNILPSQINEGDVMNNFVTYKGFNSSDFKVNLFPNDNNGILGIEVILNDNFPKDLAEKHGFTNYRNYKEYSGFMPTSLYNKQFSIDFKEDNDPSLIEIKKLTTQAIIEGIANKNLEINGVKYTSKADLIEKVFIKSIGSKLPTNWESLSEDQLKIDIRNNNEAGTLNISLFLKKDVVEGMTSDLNLVKSYSGFVKGNKTPTADNLSFISQELLSTITELKGKDAKYVESWLFNGDKTNNDPNVENLKKLFLTYTGAYVDAIEQKKFKLITDVNEVYNTISIRIIFNEDVHLSSGSLNEYSVQYHM